MGCRIAKSVLAAGDDARSRTPPPSAAAAAHQKSSSPSSAADASKSSLSEPRPAESSDPVSMLSPKQFKARLERLMCVARETPEPIFELSACDMRTVPAGVFILCKVLRKERLDLSRNRLRSLSDGGALTDLLLITHLDLSGNAFKMLPDELVQLVNLQELNVQNNRLAHLPANLHQLRRLEFLDVSRNQLQDISTIACMHSLRVLNVSGNPQLQRLPMELSTCPSLADIVCDAATVQDPPPHIVERGTHAMLAYFMGNLEAWRDFPPQTRLQVEVAKEVVEDDAVADNVFANEPDNMEQISNQLQIDQRKNREELLQQIMKQQYDKDALVSELQLKRDMERNKLIEDIANAESESSQAVDRLLRFRTDARRSDVDAADAAEQFELLDLVRVQQHADLQRTKVLDEMSAQLGREHAQIAAYEMRRDHEHGQLLRDIEADSERMQVAVGQTDVGRSEAIEQLLSDERLQRAAVASLIDRGDGHSWALVEQVRMIEAELVRMTRDELTRRRTNADDHMSKLCEQRMDLTCLLAELMDQQDRRKKQLLDSLQRMETDQQDKHQDFWLLQYQKLLDARSANDSTDSALDPRLGYQLLTHDVIHLLPFLSRLLRSAKDVELLAIDDGQLRAAGIRDAADRKQILRAIEAFADALEAEHAIPSAPSACDSSTGQTDLSAEVERPPTASSTVEGLAECVVCMERSSNTIFLPCGHLCCCAHCQEPLSVCPMCRASIERRIKVIQA